MLVITHYQRLLDYIKPDRVHVLAGGRIVASGGPELALELEARRLRPVPAEARRERSTAAIATWRRRRPARRGGTRTGAGRDLRGLICARRRRPSPTAPATGAPGPFDGAGRRRRSSSSTAGRSASPTSIAAGEQTLARCASSRDADGHRPRRRGPRSWRGRARRCCCWRATRATARPMSPTTARHRPGRRAPHGAHRRWSTSRRGASRSPTPRSSSRPARPSPRRSLTTGAQAASGIETACRHPGGGAERAPRRRLSAGRRAPRRPDHRRRPRGRGRRRPSS